MRNDGGWRTISRPIATRCRWPPESAGLRCIRSYSPRIGDRVSCPLVDLPLGRLAQLEPECQVVDDRCAGKGVVLKDDGDVAIGGVLRCHQVPLRKTFAVGDRLQPGDHPQRRGLAAARRADEDDELAVGDVEVERPNRLRAVRVHLPDIVRTISAVAPPPQREALPDQQGRASGRRRSDMVARPRRLTPARYRRVDVRTTSSGSGTTGSSCPCSPLSRSSSARAATAPCSATPWRTVVSPTTWATSWSSIPMRETSPGTSTPSSSRREHGTERHLVGQGEDRRRGVRPRQQLERGLAAAVDGELPAGDERRVELRRRRWRGHRRAPSMRLAGTSK